VPVGGEEKRTIVLALDGLKKPLGFFWNEEGYCLLPGRGLYENRCDR